MNDDSIMPFGEHKGKKLANIPAQYLLWIDGQDWCPSDLKDYIKDNMDSLEFEAKGGEDRE